jgi:hypothetical protein
VDRLPEWMPEVDHGSQPVWCPNCSEEFGIEKEIERAEKRGMRHILEYLKREHFLGASVIDQMLKQLEEYK